MFWCRLSLEGIYGECNSVWSGVANWAVPHPSDKNRDVARVGHPRVWFLFFIRLPTLATKTKTSRGWGTHGFGFGWGAAESVGGTSDLVRRFPRLIKLGRLSNGSGDEWVNG